MKRSITNILFKEWEWVLASCPGSFDDILQKDLSILTWDIHESTKFNYADPHVTEIGGKSYIFCEKISKIYKKGEIEYISEDEFHNEDTRNFKKFLREPYHLSFPIVNSIDEEYLITCESSEADGLIGWKFDDDFNVNEKLSLINKPLIDPVIFSTNDTYYLLGSIRIKKQEYKFTVHYSTDLKNWKEIPPRDIKTSSQSSRNAGGFIFSDREIYRLSQILEPSYGSGIEINRIVSLSRSEYIEEKVKEIRPVDIVSGKYDGLHTLTASKNKIYVDLRYSRIDLFAFPKKIIRRIRKYLYLPK